MANRMHWCSRGVLVAFSVAAVLCITFCLNVICKTSYQKRGLITIRFNLPNIGGRGELLPVVPHAIPGVVSVAVGGAHSVAGAAATAASGVANGAKSAVLSAATSIETAVESIVPKNCSLGVEYFCISFTDHVDCSALPLKVSSIIPSSITAIEKLGNVEDLDRALAGVTPKNIKGCLIIGAVFAALAMLLGIYSLCALALQTKGFVSSPLILRVSTHLRSLCSIVCLIPILVLTVILYGLRLKAKLPMEFTLETGEASKQILAALTCAISMGVLIIVGWILDHYIGDLSWITL